jgi:hypothetical protein
MAQGISITICEARGSSARKGRKVTAECRRFSLPRPDVECPASTIPAFRQPIVKEYIEGLEEFIFPQAGWYLIAKQTR